MLFCYFSIFLIGFEHLAFIVSCILLSIYREDRHVVLTARGAVNATWRGARTPARSEGPAHRIEGLCFRCGARSRRNASHATAQR